MLSRLFLASKDKLMIIRKRLTQAAFHEYMANNHDFSFKKFTQAAEPVVVSLFLEEREQQCQIHNAVQ